MDGRLTYDLCPQAVATEFQNESAAALAAAATRHLLEAEQAKNSGNQHWWAHAGPLVPTLHCPLDKSESPKDVKAPKHTSSCVSIAILWL